MSGKIAQLDEKEIKGKPRDLCASTSKRLSTNSLRKRWSSITQTLNCGHSEAQLVPFLERLEAFFEYGSVGFERA